MVLKGKKRGIRRFQNEDGTLTEEGKRRYYDEVGLENKKSKKQMDSSSLNKKKHKVDDYERRKKAVNTFIKVTAGIAIATALAYGSYKAYEHFEKYGDYSIRQGTELVRVQSESEQIIGKQPFYASYKKGDVATYKALLTQTRMRQKGKVFIATGKVGRKLKVAGSATAEKVYNDLLQNNSEFRSGIEKTKSSRFRVIPANAKNDYEVFNIQALCGKPGESTKKLRDIFYEALKKKGYDGVLDNNDKSGPYGTKKPTIIFNASGIIGTKISSFSRDDIMKSKKAYESFARRKKIKDKLLNSFSKHSGKFILADLALLGVGAASRRSINLEQKYSKEIQEYRKEHPNTKLSNYDIARMLDDN